MSFIWNQIFCQKWWGCVFRAEFKLTKWCVWCWFTCQYLLFVMKYLSFKNTIQSCSGRHASCHRGLTFRPLLLPLFSPLRSAKHSFTARLPRISVATSVLLRRSHRGSFMNMSMKQKAGAQRHPGQNRVNQAAELRTQRWPVKWAGVGKSPGGYSTPCCQLRYHNQPQLHDILGLRIFADAQTDFSFSFSFSFLFCVGDKRWHKKHVGAKLLIIIKLEPWVCINLIRNVLLWISFFRLMPDDKKWETHYLSC